MYAHAYGADVELFGRRPPSNVTFQIATDISPGIEPTAVSSLTSWFARSVMSPPPSRDATGPRGPDGRSCSTPRMRYRSALSDAMPDAMRFTTCRWCSCTVRV